MVLHHAVEPATKLEEMARIVRPGGTILVTDEVEHPYEWMREDAGLADYGYEPLGMQ